MSTPQLAADLKKAEELFSNGDYDDAIEIYEIVLARDETNSTARDGIDRARRVKANEENALRKRPPP